MRPPAYILLPIFGAVVLTVAVLGSWLWPAPTAPSPSVAPPIEPVATQAPALTPAPRPPPSRPAARPAVANPAPVVAQPQSGAVPPTPSEDAASSEPVTLSPWANMGPEKVREFQQKWSGLRARASDLAMRGVQELERERAEAQARGDQAEYERLDALLRQQMQGVERMREIEAEAPPESPQLPPKGYTGPPVE